MQSASQSTQWDYRIAGNLQSIGHQYLKASGEIEQKDLVHAISGI